LSAEKKKNPKKLSDLHDNRDDEEDSGMHNGDSKDDELDYFFKNPVKNGQSPYK
jgi:hypothetical protein